METQQLKLLDLFCGAGGCSVGYHRAGFTDIVGVDIVLQKRYPFEFVQADALEYLAENGHKFDLIHASPPCQTYSIAKSLTTKNYPDLVAETRELLLKIGRPYIIENVPSAPLENPLMLCGTMFGLRVIRHRLFEIWPEPIWFSPYSCNHNGKSSSNRLKDKNGKRVLQSFEHLDLLCIVGHDFRVSDGKIAMGIDWMTGKELAQAIPPAYTEWIGKQLYGNTSATT